jgi:hypothetical protein
MAKCDVRKLYRECYSAADRQYQMICVPPMQFLMVDGCGDPEGSEYFGQCVETIMSLAQELRSSNKRVDFVMPPLEGLWWMDEPCEFSAERRDRWRWTLMLAQPDVVTPGMLDAAKAALLKRADNPEIKRVRLERYDEGLACQTLHVGPYSRLNETIHRIHAYVHSLGHHLRGKHHEVYISDRRKSPPAELRTIVRYAVL